MIQPDYRRRLGVFRNPAVRHELRTLDPTRDYERMVQLLIGYEFPFDINRALELALFHTYASPRVSALTNRTGEFEQHGQRRYDDTAILIARFIQHGLDSDRGARAIEHINRIHGFYQIANEDFLFVLATFIFYPIDWVNRYGWRKLTSSEEQAFYYFFREVGHRMHLQAIPGSLEAFREFNRQYEANYFRYAESNRRVADATIRVVQGWFPRFLRPVVKQAVAGLISDSLRQAFGYPPPARLVTALLNGLLWLRKWPLRWITVKPYPTLIENSYYHSYPNGVPEVEAMGPEKLLRRINK
ncbi:oxygenase MpaB family protein [Nibrella viscosa]|uniref:Oxygenase MpaB family protein n=1 Tax=Nibrella viscosa TaxID=1084524 RepID=A0ABP8JZ40_9BACT